MSSISARAKASAPMWTIFWAWALCMISSVGQPWICSHATLGAIIRAAIPTPSHGPLVRSELRASVAAIPAASPTPKKSVECFGEQTDAAGEPEEDPGARIGQDERPRGEDGSGSPRDREDAVHRQEVAAPEKLGRDHRADRRQACANFPPPSVRASSAVRSAVAPAQRAGRMRSARTESPKKIVGRRAMIATSGAWST